LERNHANLVFITNEPHPVWVEEDDRRFEIIEYNTKYPADYYRELAEEIDNGGADAFLNYLLNYDTQGYRGIGEKPMDTDAKEQIKELSRGPVESFLVDWMEGKTRFPCCACLPDDLWNVYKLWCVDSGFRVLGTKNGFGQTVTRVLGQKTRPAWVDGVQIRVRFPSSPGSPQDTEREIAAFKESYTREYMRYLTENKL
jgi:putative DNA primase/helicase